MENSLTLGKIIAVILMNLSDGYSIALIFLCFFAKKITVNRKKIICTFAIFTICLIFSVITNNSSLEFLTMLLFPFLLALFCTSARIYNLWMALSAFLLWISFYVFDTGTISLMIKQELQRKNFIMNDFIIELIFQLIKFSLLLLFISFLKKRNIQFTLNSYEVLGYNVYVIFTIFQLFLYYFLNKQNPASLSRVLCGGFLIIFTYAIFIIYTGWLLNRRRNHKLKLQINEIENNFNIRTQLLENEEKDNQELRQFRHDWKNHLQIVRELHANGSYKEAEKYIEGLSKKSNILNLSHMTGNQVADTILSIKKKEAVKNGITFQCNGDFKKLCRIEPVDIGTIFFNVLDNAIKAATGTENATISVQGINHENYFVLIVKNTISKPVHIHDNRIKTSHKDKKNHGFGIENVKNIASKYHGECILSSENKEFTIKLFLLI